MLVAFLSGASALWPGVELTSRRSAVGAAGSFFIASALPASARNKPVEKDDTPFVRQPYQLSNMGEFNQAHLLHPPLIHFPCLVFAAGQYKKYASGKPPTKAEQTAALAEAKATAISVCDAFSHAYASASDTAALYAEDAVILDASKGSSEITGSDSVRAYVASLSYPGGPPRLTLVSAVPEKSSVVHAEYQLTTGSKTFRGTWKLVADSSGSWLIDESVLPLDSTRAYSALEPKKNYFGNRYMELK